MAPVQVVGPIARLIGYALFVVWCALVGLAISAVGLLRVGRFAVGGRRGPAPTLP